MRTKYIVRALNIYCTDGKEAYNNMDKLVRAYKKNGFNVKIYSPETTEYEKIAKTVEIKEKVIKAIKRNMVAKI